MLDLVDAVIDQLRGPVMFVCLARPEFLEERSNWGVGKRSITMTLAPLSAEDARLVARHLMGDEAPSAIVEQVCQAADGNPLYLEQLTAMLVDQGLLVNGVWKGETGVSLDIPATLQALLAARLDRLDPGPRLVLERASIVGRRFRTAAVLALTGDLVLEQISTSLAALERKGFVQLEDVDDRRWRFTHALVVEAAYRGLSKELRADLHERLADWTIEEDADKPDVDESVARQLEHALRLREELGDRGAHSAQLSERAGGLFAASGLRAFDALDYLRSRDLLGRAATLLPVHSLQRLALLPNLGAALADSGQAEQSETLLAEGIELANSASSERDALRATVQLLSNKIYGSSTYDQLTAAAEEAREAFAAFTSLGDGVGQAEAAIALDNLAYARGHVAEAQRWSCEALGHALSSRRPREATQGAGDLLGFAIVGPLPFDDFGGTAESLPCPGHPISDSVGLALRAVAALAKGDEVGFRENESRWRDLLGRHGLAWLAAAQALEVAIVEMSVGRAEAAELRIREARDFFVATGNLWYVSIADGFLCDAVGEQNRPSAFLKLADAFAATVLMNDLHSLIKRHLILARGHLLRGSLTEAHIVLQRGLELVAPTDFELDHANALVLYADVLAAVERDAEASTARGQAVERLRAKGIRGFPDPGPTAMSVE